MEILWSESFVHRNEPQPPRGDVLRQNQEGCIDVFPALESEDGFRVGRDVADDQQTFKLLYRVHGEVDCANRIDGTKGDVADPCGIDGLLPGKIRRVPGVNIEDA